MMPCFSKIIIKITGHCFWAKGYTKLSDFVKALKTQICKIKKKILSYNFKIKWDDSYNNMLLGNNGVTRKVCCIIN